MGGKSGALARSSWKLSKLGMEDTDSFFLSTVFTISSALVIRSWVYLSEETYIKAVAVAPKMLARPAAVFLGEIANGIWPARIIAFIIVQ